MTSIGILPSSLQTALHELVDRSNAGGGGIRVILLSTSEGVPLGRIFGETGGLLEESTLSSLESTWAPAPKQLTLLLGKKAQARVKSVTAMYETGATLIHFYITPVVVTIVLSPNANVGGIQSTTFPLLQEILNPLCQTLLTSLSPSQDAPDYYQ
jgi:hypothetical protein